MRRTGQVIPFQRPRPASRMRRVARRPARARYPHPLRGVLTALLLVGCFLLVPEGVERVHHAQAVDGCTVMRVIDGDTVDLTCPGRGGERARLTGFNTPELSGAKCLREEHLAQKSRSFLARQLASAERLQARYGGQDKYDRALYRLWLDGEPLADIMVASGLAHRYAGGRRGSWCH